MIFFRQMLGRLLDPNDDRLSITLKQQIQCVADEFESINTRLDELNQQLAGIAKDNPCCQLLMSIPGIGCINATALYSAIGNGSQFKSAREFAVWLGITPKHFASGNKHIMSGITKRGDRYLRKQLIHGARAVMTRCKKRDDHLSKWVTAIVLRRGPNKACVALAHKMARLCWVLLQRNEMYKSQ